MKVEKTNNPINRVKCVVNSCHFWDSNHCQAASIEIQPPNATNSDTTDCATFAPKDNM